MKHDNKGTYVLGTDAGTKELLVDKESMPHFRKGTVIFRVFSEL